MGVDLTGARVSAEQYLLGDTCYFLRPRVVDDGAGGTKPDPAGPERIGPFNCAFAARSGREVVSADQLKVIGEYKLKLATKLTHPTTKASFTPQDTDQVEALGGVYSVVHAPPPAALSLFRTIGLTLA
jgi:hypothetical protein